MKKHDMPARGGTGTLVGTAGSKAGLRANTFLPLAQYPADDTRIEIDAGFSLAIRPASRYS
jgi:hypothetical protein